MLYRLGVLSMKVHPFNVQGLSRSNSHAFVEKPVFGGTPPLESVGGGVETLSFTGTLLPKNIGGLGELELLYTMMRTGLPQFLMRGDGRAMGFYVVDSVSDDSSYLDSRGVGQVVAVTFTLKKSGPPFGGLLFQILAGIFL